MTWERVACGTRGIVQRRGIHAQKLNPDSCERNLTRLSWIQYLALTKESKTPALEPLQDGPDSCPAVYYAKGPHNPRVPGTQSLCCYQVTKAVHKGGRYLLAKAGHTCLLWSRPGEMTLNLPPLPILIKPFWRCSRIRV